MFVSGFTFIRNAVRYDYPVTESIRSLLPLVDELVICLGNSDDSTEELIRSIADPRIRIIHSVWDDTLREGGQVLAVETNKAFDAISSNADWAIYLQADEVIHEADHPAIREAMQKYLHNNSVEGLLFNYVHFYGSYHFKGDSRRWYRHEIRVIRNDKSIRSYRDAQGFRKSGQKLIVAAIPARIFHYGWVKNPLKQQEKQKNFHKLWHDDKSVSVRVGTGSDFDYSEIDSLTEFKDTHPAYMKERIATMDWQFSYHPSQKKLKLKDKVLLWFENLSGYRLFEYKNYKKLY